MAWVLVWLLSMTSWLRVVKRLCNIAEHALMVQNGTDPLRHAHTSVLERAPIAPYRVNHHGEHPVFTQVPCWSLPKAHQLLAACGVTAPMQIQLGYVRVLQLATVRSAAFGTVDGVN